MHKKKPRIVRGAIRWRCPTCRKWLSPLLYYADRRTSNGLRSQCKRCHIAASLRSRDKEKHKIARRESARRTRRRNPEKHKAKERKRPRRTGPKVDARQIVHLALRIGAIVRPETCEDCGQAKRLTAHHTDYKKPLSVRWLCYVCHAALHPKK